MGNERLEYDCDKGGGFKRAPNEHPRIGYITSLAGLGLSQALPADLQVSVPFNASSQLPWPGLPLVAPSPNASMGAGQVVGVIEKFAWDGGAGSPLAVDLYVSQANATQLKTIQQAPGTKLSSLSWWIANYDQKAKVWFEQSYPLPSGSAITGVVAGQGNPELNVDLSSAVAVQADVNLYKVSIQVAPGASQNYSLFAANSSDSSTAVRWNWGLSVKK